MWPAHSISINPIHSNTPLAAIPLRPLGPSPLRPLGRLSTVVHCNGCDLRCGVIHCDLKQCNRILNSFKFPDFKFQPSGFKLQISTVKFKLKFKVQNSQFKFQLSNFKCELQIPIRCELHVKCEMWNVECELQVSMWNVKCGIFIIPNVNSKFKCELPGGHPLAAPGALPLRPLGRLFTVIHCNNWFHGDSRWFTVVPQDVM